MTKREYPFRVFPPRLKTVSYTHLDVYKRQALLDQGVAPQAAMGLIGVVIVGPLLCLSRAMARRVAASSR